MDNTFAMDWKFILQLQAWTPLRRVVSGGDFVLPGIYAIGTNAYLRTQHYNQAFENNHPEAPFITEAYWAPSIDALKYNIQRDTTININDSLQKPPEELLLGTSGTYGELEQLIPSSEKRVSERAVYSFKGIFVHKIIEIDRFSYHYLRPTIKKDDRVYAIKVSLI